MPAIVVPKLLKSTLIFFTVFTSFLCTQYFPNNTDVIAIYTCHSSQGNVFDFEINTDNNQISKNQIETQNLRRIPIGESKEVDLKSDNRDLAQHLQNGFSRVANHTYDSNSKLTRKIDSSKSSCS